MTVDFIYKYSCWHSEKSDIVRILFSNYFFMVKTIDVLDDLEKFSRECYFDMSQWTNETFWDIESKYMEILVKKYGFTLNSARNFVRECELDQLTDIKESLESSLPTIAMRQEKVDIIKVMEDFMNTWNMATAFKNVWASLSSLEKIEDITLSNIKRNTDNTITNTSSNNLDKEEEIFRIIKSKWVYASPIFLALLSLPYFSMEWMAWPGLLMVLLSSYFFARSYRYEWYMTTKRVVKKTWVFFRSEEEMVESKIETVWLLNVLVWQNASVKWTW
jgi:hypothetical protein